MSQQVLPAARQKWVHQNGNEYVVVLITNKDSDRPEYPTTVCYVSLKDGKAWSKTQEEFLKKMTFVESLPSPKCDIMLGGMKYEA